MATSTHGATMRNRLLLLAAMAIGGLTAGLLLDVLTAWVSAAGPSSADGQYTLRGNGALIVPIGGGLVLVTAAWTALTMRWLGHARALAIGVGAGAFELAVVLMAGLVLDIFAPAAWREPLRPVMGALWILTFALPVAAPVAAAIWLRPKVAAQTESGWTVVAMILFPVSLFAGAALSPSLSQLAG